MFPTSYPAREEDDLDIILKFICHDCHYTIRIYASDDPTSSSGCCKNCGSSRWEVVDLLGRRVY